jgi:hypothetical protein
VDEKSITPIHAKLAAIQRFSRGLFTSECRTRG